MLKSQREKNVSNHFEEKILKEKVKNKKINNKGKEKQAIFLLIKELHI